MFIYSQKKKKTKESITKSIQGFLEALLDYSICLYIMLMLVIFPFYQEEGYAHIGTDKAAFFCRLSVNTGKILVIPLLLYLIVIFIDLVKGRRKACSIKKLIREHVTLTDIFAVVYCAALVLSHALSDYGGNALWGAERWYMGTIPQLILVMIYFLISRLWCPRRWVLLLMLPASAAVFILGCLNRFGIYPIEMAYASPGFISTIGNINWFCGYAVSVTFVGTTLFWLERNRKSWWKVMMAAYVTLAYVSLVIQGSDSGLVALAVVLFLMFCLSVKDQERMSAFWQEMVMLWGGCVVVYGIRWWAPDSMNFKEGLLDVLTFGWIPVVMMLVSILGLLLVWSEKRRGKFRSSLFRTLAKTAFFGGIAAFVIFSGLIAVNTLKPGSIGPLSDYGILTFNEKWGSNRGATWSAGWRCFTGQNVLHKLVGVGPDCMWEYISGGENAELLADVKEKFGNNRLTNAHNEWLTILVDTGILGLAGFGGMMLCGMRELLKKSRENPVICACGFCLLAYTVNNIFSFQQAMSTGTIFVIFGIGEAFLRNGDRAI